MQGGEHAALVCVCVGGGGVGCLGGEERWAACGSVGHADKKLL
jgi:hypothetical protein